MVFRGVCLGALVLMAGYANADGDLPMISFTPSGNDLIVEGVIGSHAPEKFRRAAENYPDANRLVLLWVPGSIDDERNLELARMVRTRGLSTVIPANGLTASGGTDLFLSGARRAIEAGACIGVHTWGDEEAGVIGSELEKDHPDHGLYLDYYREMGAPEDFYWFTLDAAGPDDAHWMTGVELNAYGFTSQALDPERDSEPRDRCEARLMRASIR